MSHSVSDPTLSFIENPSTSSNGRDDVDSLPGSLDSDSESDGGSDYSDAEREWRESLQQLELLLSMVVIPYLGKYVGRKCAYWGGSLPVLPIS
jgi:Mitochondrial import 2